MSTHRCHRVKCKTKERAEQVRWIMGQKSGVPNLYVEFCGLCRAWHVVRERLGDQRPELPDSKSRAAGND
jgi:hypothetical protein